jgi:hypothetical protein
MKLLNRSFGPLVRILNVYRGRNSEPGPPTEQEEEDLTGVRGTRAVRFL